MAARCANFIVAFSWIHVLSSIGKREPIALLYCVHVLSVLVNLFFLFMSLVPFFR